MPQYLSPGVYVEEVPSASQPIAGVSTSTAGFIGLVADKIQMPPQPSKFELDEQGNIKLSDDGKPIPIRYTVAPAGEAQLITSWEQFKNKFGDFQAGNKILAHAVYGFFNNGGTRCWITRVVNDADVDAHLAALAEFESIDEISLVIAPGTANAIQQAVVDHCQKAEDRFAILDGTRNPEALTADVIKTVNASDYAAVYFPWLEVYDPVTKANDFVPPSGHMAGIYARVDGQRGVHKAPANEVVRGALGLEWRLSRADQDGLNPHGINVIRDLNGAIRVWGARTLADKPEWTYVNVRRLFLYLRESIDEGTQWVVFEPNDRNLWAKIARNVSAFLTNVWRDGALFGSTPEEAFYVRCDDTINPPEVRDLGQVITEIGVAVTKPAEFVIFRISQWGGPGAS